MYRLTKEGRRYLDAGLPEKKLIGLLREKGDMKMGDAKGLISDFNIALQWCKKYDCIEMNGGIIKLVSDKIPDDISEQETGLSCVDEGRAVGKGAASILL